jgi:hypothetical protein
MPDVATQTDVPEETEFHKGLRVGYYLAMTKCEKDMNVKLKKKRPSIEDITKHPKYKSEYNKIYKSGYLKGSLEGLKSKTPFKILTPIGNLNKDELRALIQQENKKKGYNVLPKYSTKSKQELFNFLVSIGYPIA